jgi:hypothetical protein
MRPIAFAGLTAISALLLAGCSDVIDAGKLEDEIKNDAGAAGLVVDEVDCPEADAKAGESFDCTVTVKGEEKKVEIQQVDDEGNVTYDLAPLVEGTSGADGGGDEASITSVIEAVNADFTALCAYSTAAYKQVIMDGTGQASCEEAVAGEKNDPIEDLEVAIQGDKATVTGTDSSGRAIVSLERAEDGTWEISGIQ